MSGWERKAPESGRKAAGGRTEALSLRAINPAVTKGAAAGHNAWHMPELDVFCPCSCLFIYHLHCACLAGSPPRARPTPPGTLTQRLQPGVPTQRPPGHPPTAGPTAEPVPQSREAWDSIGTNGAPATARLHRSSQRKPVFFFPGNVGKQTRSPLPAPSPGLRLPSAIGDPTSHGNESPATFGSGDGGEGSQKLGAPGTEPGGDTRDSARQEWQEFVPAQGNRTQV